MLKKKSDICIEIPQGKKMYPWLNKFHAICDPS